MSVPTDPDRAQSRTGLSGGVAAINLVPTAAETHPVSGHLGDVVVDASGRLWFCRGGTLWHQLA